MTLVLNQLSYSYGSKKVLRTVSTVFEAGATVLLGPNGAGKSTLLALVATTLAAEKGAVRVGELDAASRNRRAEREYRRAVAWLPQKLSLFPGLNVREHVAYSGWLKGMTKGDAWDQSDEALALVGLRDRSDHSVKSLSGGQQRRVGIAGALVHSASVVLLDEPTAGLDPAQRQRFRSVLENISQDRTVIVSSHDTDDAHSAFDSVAVLNDGQLVFHGSMPEFVSTTDPAADARDRVESAYIQWVGVEE